MAFMKAVLDEVCTMFPSEVIHIGGDEVPKSAGPSAPSVKPKCGVWA